MALAIGTLADGQLPNSKTTLYTVPASTTAFVQVTLVATGASARTVNIYLKRSGGTSRRIFPKDLSINPGDHASSKDERPYSLSTGDIIEGDASAASEVDYIIEGVERA